MPSKIVLQQTWVGDRGSQQGQLVRADSTLSTSTLGVPSREEVEFAQRDYLKVSKNIFTIYLQITFTISKFTFLATPVSV